MPHSYDEDTLRTSGTRRTPARHYSRAWQETCSMSLEMSEPYKYCPTCGQRNAVPRPVCGRCGAVFSDDPLMQAPASPQAMRRRTARRAAMVGGALILLGFAAYALTPPRGCAIYRCGPAATAKMSKPYKSHTSRHHGV